MLNSIVGMGVSGAATARARYRVPGEGDTMLAVRDISKLLSGVPKGAWVALSKEEDRVIAYAAELQEVLAKAKDAGENDPVITRVPESDSPSLLL